MKTLTKPQDAKNIRKGIKALVDALGADVAYRLFAKPDGYDSIELSRKAFEGLTVHDIAAEARKRKRR